MTTVPRPGTVKRRSTCSSGSPAATSASGSAVGDGVGEGGPQRIEALAAAGADRDQRRAGEELLAFRFGDHARLGVDEVQLRQRDDAGLDPQ